MEGTDSVMLYCPDCGSENVDLDEGDTFYCGDCCATGNADELVFVDEDAEDRDEEDWF